MVVEAEWKPTLGAVPGSAGTRFRVWAPEVEGVELLLEGGGALRLERQEGGYHGALVKGVGAGSRYRYILDGRGPFPDPVSRYQPCGVHGPSEVVDPFAFPWTDETWEGIELGDLVIYELHVGAFTAEGTFAAAARRLPELAELGVTAVELMPLAAFPGRRNWGYDGVAPFAPAAVYGTPTDLRGLVDSAHRLGLGVLLDVVYNHLGPDGNYLGSFSPHYFDPSIHTPWGAALNFGDGSSEPVRAFFLENANHWLVEYHIDGLRLDATHAMVDRSERHLLADLADAAHRRSPRRLAIAEDERNLSTLLKSPPSGFGLDAVWSDDLHHELRRCLAGDQDGYFADFDGASSEIAETLQRGWYYTGQLSRRTGKPRGTDPSDLPRERFIICLENHDQVGNRAFGDWLHHGITAEAWRAGTALLLLAPETPLLFMGQEWAASTPFQYFTDHDAELGRRVTEGRRREFAAFLAFCDPGGREIPDPQAASTFEASCLRWAERSLPGHREVLKLHRALLRVRREEVVPRRSRLKARAVGPDAVLLDAGDLAVIVRLKAGGEVPLPPSLGPSPRVLLTTEDDEFAGDPAPPALFARDSGATACFRRAGALVLVPR